MEMEIGSRNLETTGMRVRGWWSHVGIIPKSLVVLILLCILIMVLVM